jgi:hypothetical protein
MGRWQKFAFYWLFWFAGVSCKSSFVCTDFFMAGREIMNIGYTRVPSLGLQL